MPAAIDKFEKEVRTLKDRTRAEFPEVLNMRILLQMISPSYRREVEAQFRISGADRSYEVLSRQLFDQGNEARYKFKKGLNDMQADAFATQPEQKP